LSMISSENRFPLFGIMLQADTGRYFRPASSRTFSSTAGGVA